MKKLILFFACVCMLVSCSKDDNVVIDNTPEKIIGEWVYDNPDNGIWEKQKFLSNMKFYLSYLYMNPFATQENAEGTYYYTEDSKKFTYTYQDVLGGRTYQDAVIENINDYSYTASFYNDDNTSSGRYTYHKLLDVVNLAFGESETPKYAILIPNININVFKSNNEDIATVNSSTGEITAGSKAGRTYINVITDEGIAYVEVNVTDPDNLIPDYSSALNMNEEEVKKQWPNFCVYATPVSNCIHYPIVGYDYADMIMVWLDNSKNVERVHVSVKTTVVGDSEREVAIHKYLSEKYDYQSSDNGIYIYIDRSQSQLPMAIYYSPKENLIEYQKIEINDLWEDYTNYFGKTANDLNKVYGEPFYQDATSLYYLQDNEYIDFVSFSLKSETLKVYAVSAFLKNGCDWQEALNYLNRKYYYYEKGSQVSDNYFAFTNKKNLSESNIGITFDGKNRLITYVDLTANNTKTIKVESILTKTKKIRTLPNHTSKLVVGLRR